MLILHGIIQEFLMETELIYEHQLHSNDVLAIPDICSFKCTIYFNISFRMFSQDILHSKC